VTVPPAYYRILVTRSLQELDHDREHIIQVGRRMLEMADAGLHSQPWVKKNCVDERWKRACDYFGPHKAGLATAEDEQNYEEVPDYRGLVQLEGEV